MIRNVKTRVVAILLSATLIGGTFAACSKSTSVTTSNPVQKTASENNTTVKEGTSEPKSPENTSKPSETPNANQQTEPTKKVKAKGLYLTGWTVGSMDKVKHFVELANTTEINAYVVDIKDDDGYVGYESSIPAVRDIKAWQPKYNVDKVIKEFHDNDIYVIGRLVCFKDPILSSKRPELAIKNSKGGLWRDNHGLTWLNPYNKESWPYIIEIAREGVKKGFDEIQFDYVRFANDGSKKAMNFGTDKKKHEAIDEFLAYAKKELPGVTLSADVFGIICESPGDVEDIGQNLETVGKNIEYISPMAYPSHYAVGQKVNGVTFAKPDFDPYGVVYNTLAKAKTRISKVDGYKANVRAYLQDFTATWLGKGYYLSYGPEQVKQQIKAVYDAGYEEWLFWDANNTYSEAAFLKENK
ncbi:MAG: putative glycoside hydrolase [Clostridia bacterium]|nr:putative glycoside hydrolase [Clostridia bacterium]